MFLSFLHWSTQRVGSLHHSQTLALPEFAREQHSSLFVAASVKKKKNLITLTPGGESNIGNYILSSLFVLLLSFFI